MLQTSLMFLMFFNSFLFTQTNHPMSMGILLLLQTILSCGMTGLISKNFWFSYILFLVFVGGMLILFIYMSSLASNEKMNFSLKPLIKFILFLNLSLMMIFTLDKFYLINWFFNEEFNLNNILMLINENHLSLSKMFNAPNNMIILLLINYLLLTLIMVAKITNSFMGPLRPKTY